jgi:methionyl-tRNA formyltransferase
VLEPGDGIVKDGVALVRTGDGAVFLLEGEIEGVPATTKDLAELFLPQSSLVIG